MSSPVATAFGDTYQDDYKTVVTKWSKKLDNVDKITKKVHAEWGIDLLDSLGQPVQDALLAHSITRWKKVGKLPSKDTLNMYAQISAKGALSTDTVDLLIRLNKSNDAPASGEFSLNAHEFAVVQVPELLKRAAQTVSQIFDMAQDRFNDLMAKFFKNSGQITGKRQWVTSPSKSGAPSRHAELNGQVKAEDEDFLYDGESVYGPRPPGGSPAHWSNCSCELRYLKGRSWL